MNTSHSVLIFILDSCLIIANGLRFISQATVAQRGHHVISLTNHASVFKHSA